MQVQDTQSYIHNAFTESLFLFLLCIWHLTLKKNAAYLNLRMHMCECLCARLWSAIVLKVARINPQGMEGTPHFPPTEKVKLFNINSGSGHHADYATITILHTASIDHLHPRTPQPPRFSPLPVLARPFGIKTYSGRGPCWRPMQTYINTFSHYRPQSQSFMRVLNSELSETPTPSGTTHSGNTS